MLNQRINPFAAILALTIIGAIGTLFVVHQIFSTDLIYAHADVRAGVTPHELLTSPN